MTSNRGDADNDGLHELLGIGVDASPPDDRLISAIADGTAVFCRVALDPQPRIEVISPAIWRLTGYSVDDFIADPDLIRRLVHPDDRRRLETVLGDPSQAAGQSGFRLVHRDGRILQADHVAAIVRDDRGAATAVELLVRDISGLDDDVPPASEGSFGEYADEIPAVAYLAHGRRFVRVSSRIEQLTGFTPDEWLNEPALWTARMHPDDHARVEYLCETGAAGKPWQAEYRWIARDGHIVWIRQACAPIRSRAGAVVCLHGVMLDGSTFRQVEAVSRASDRMDAVSRLAGVVAHDFNNLLTVVLGHAEMLLDTFRETGPARGSLVEIKNAADAAARITNQLLAASGRQALSLSRVDVNDVVRDIADTLYQLAGGDVDIRFDLASDLPPVDLDTKQFERVLRNLVVDARDALPAGGRMTIATRAAVRSDGRDVCLTVSDSRPRATDETTASLFEPSLGPKKSARGAGLNRAAVYGIVHQMGGHVTIETPASGGLTFTIRLPVQT